MINYKPLTTWQQAPVSFDNFPKFEGDELVEILDINGHSHIDNGYYWSSGIANIEVKEWRIVQATTY
jgi:hypothetical protein